MTRKLYYTDALAAAYMASEFGVIFTKEIKAGLWQSSLHHDSAIDYDIKITPRRGRKIDKRLSPYKPPFYIHPDSYHIFEPQVGDLVKINYGICNDEYDKSANDHYQVISLVRNKEFQLARTPRYFSFNKMRRIIQRNNKPFFWPEEEV